MDSQHLRTAQTLAGLAASTALEIVSDGLTLGNLVIRDFQPDVAEARDTVNVPIPLGSGDSLRLGNVEVVLKHLESTFVVPDISRILAAPTLLRPYMEPAALAISWGIEESIWECISSATMEHPTSGTKYLVVGPREYSAMRMNPEFQESAYPNLGGLGGRTVVRSLLAKDRSVEFVEGSVFLVTRRLKPSEPNSGELSEYAETQDFGLRVTVGYDASTLAQRFTIEVLLGCGTSRKLRKN